MLTAPENQSDCLLSPHIGVWSLTVHLCWHLDLISRCSWTQQLVQLNSKRINPILVLATSGIAEFACNHSPT
jgi:hypothetical protein